MTKNAIKNNYFWSLRSISKNDILNCIVYFGWKERCYQNPGPAIDYCLKLSLRFERVTHIREHVLFSNELI